MDVQRQSTSWDTPTDKGEMERFKSSVAYKTIKEYIEVIDTSIREGSQTFDTERAVDIDTLSPHSPPSFAIPTVSLLLKMLSLVEEVPLEDEDQRYGNKGFVTLYNRLREEGPSMVKEVFPEASSDDVQIIQQYLLNSFGNSTRIDYGTGHELNFLCLVIVLHKLGLIQTSEIFVVMECYFSVIRTVILKYNLEPAGSHGIWGIDDYQLLPFLFGSSQVCRTGEKSFAEILSPSNRWLCYAKSLRFVCLHKTTKKEQSLEERVELYSHSAPDPSLFASHSPMLYGLKKVPWCKINLGMKKMYDNEVLSKFVVIQHFISSKVLQI